MTVHKSKNYRDDSAVIDIYEPDNWTYYACQLAHIFRSP